MRTPYEIKKGLACSEKRYCIYESCPYYSIDDLFECLEKSREDALAYIQQLERERDAAVACIPHACGYCKHLSSLIMAAHPIMNVQGLDARISVV